MKKFLILATLFFSLSFYGQSIFLTGNAYIGLPTSVFDGDKSENFVMVTINKNKNTVAFSINGRQLNYLIESSNITNGGKAIKFILSEGMQMTIAILSKMDVVMFPWDVSKGTVGGIMVKLTSDDKKLLGLN